MDEKLYDLCDWAEIEAIVYSEHDNPHSILGAHVTDDGILVNVFIPEAEKVTVLAKSKKYPMEVADEAGFFAALIPGKKVFAYKLEVVYKDGNKCTIADPYSFDPYIDGMDINEFGNGIGYGIYNKLGSHAVTIDGVDGTSFAVWAPNAMRVSVIGDFNNWDGRIHQMRRLGDSGIFEIFVPGAGNNAKYKYEIKLRGDLCVMKSDPYAFYSEVMPENASVVFDVEGYEWSDSKWMDTRKKNDITKSAVSIYQVDLLGFAGKKVDEATGEMSYFNYKEIAPKLAEYVKKMNYTHVELMPVMEHMWDESNAYDVSGYYAPTSRYGTPKDFMEFINYMHKQEIGVILDWVPAYCSRDNFALGNYDGTCLYEHQDPKKGVHPTKNTLMFNYARPQVTSFLIANAMYWVEKYHVDGLRINDVASMLYLDYDRKPGQWLPNIYGGNENLDGIEFLKHLNSIMKKRYPDVAMIAQENTLWTKVTGDIDKEDGLGFTFKWNAGYVSDLMDYMKYDPLFRKGQHNQLTLSMMYNYSERYMLALSHDWFTEGKGTLVARMPGEYEQKFANAKAVVAYNYMHPGKKLIFMGQDMVVYDEWKPADWMNFSVLEYDNHKQFNNMISTLNKLYKEHSALYSEDYISDGFEWINDNDSSRSIVSFIRRDSNTGENLLVVANFTPVAYENYIVGVPFKGKYKEIFNSDDEAFGGSGVVNKRVKVSKKEKSEGREDSITITVPPMGVCVFSCTKAVEDAVKETVKDAAKEEKAEAPKKVEATKQASAKTTTKAVSKTKAKADAVKKTEAKKTDETKKTVKTAAKEAIKSTVGKAVTKASSVTKKTTKKEVK